MTNFVQLDFSMQITFKYSLKVFRSCAWDK